MKRKIITIAQIENWLKEGKQMLFLDVMNPEYFAEKHIEGAENAPVYEVVFPTYLEKLGLDKKQLIVVYNQVESSLATQDAATKLAKLGFENVWEFPGGLEKWEAAGFPVAVGAQVPVPKIEDGEYSLDLTNSLAGWSGRNVKYAHHGTINLKRGKVRIEKSKLAEGEFVLDMTSIKDLDLTDEGLKNVLETHLKSSDFFDVENFPEATFVLKKSSVHENAAVGTPNYQLEGQLTIKDVSRRIEFPAMIVPMGEGVLNGQAHFDFDRTLWNVRYGSEKFFEKLGMHLVNDMVSLELFLVAKK